MLLKIDRANKYIRHTICFLTASRLFQLFPRPLQYRQILPTVIFSPRYFIKPRKSVKYSISGINKLWAFVICSTFSSNEVDFSVQNRQSSSSSLIALAIFPSITDSCSIYVMRNIMYFKLPVPHSRII